MRGGAGQMHGGGWLRGLRVYLIAVAAGNLAWEVLQLPLYTIWDSGTMRAQAFAVVHCTGGDLLIALSALMLALLIAGDSGWPHRRFGRVAALAVLFGLSYTAVSEWLNVVVRASWAYSDRMPVIAAFGLRLGLAPLLQWLVIPSAAFVVTRPRMGANPTASVIDGPSSVNMKEDRAGGRG